MDAFSNIVEDGGTSYGISAAIEAARNRRTIFFFSFFQY